MKAWKCEMCGSIDIKYREGSYICEYCGAKYTANQIKKMLVELTGEVTVKNMGNVENYMKLAKNAKESNNYKVAEDYCDRALEIDADNYEAWLIKAGAIGWRLDLSKPRFLEAVKCFKKAVDNAPADKKEEVIGQEIDEMKEILEGYGKPIGEYYKSYPADYKAKDIIKSLSKIKDNILEFANFVKTDFSEYMRQIAVDMDEAVMEAYHNNILKKYEGDDGRPGNYQFDNFIEMALLQVQIEDVALTYIIGNSEEDKNAKIRIYNNEIEILTKRLNACSWWWSSSSSSWRKDQVLSSEDRKKNETMLEERYLKIKELDPNYVVKKQPRQWNIQESNVGCLTFIIVFIIVLVLANASPGKGIREQYKGVDNIMLTSELKDSVIATAQAIYDKDVFESVESDSETGINAKINYTFKDRGKTVAE